MLSINDYNHLKLLYENFFKFNTYIKDLIESQDYDSIDVAIQEKDSLIRQIINFEKPRIDDIKENPELHKIRLDLIEKEKENIVLLTSIRDKIKNDITALNKAKKVINTYEPQTVEPSATFEIKEEE